MNVEDPSGRTQGNNFRFVRLYVNDHPKSLEFYKEVCGLHEVKRHEPPKVPALEVFLRSDTPSASLINLSEINDAIRPYIVGGSACAGSAIFCFEVIDVGFSKKRAVELGGEIIMEGGRVVWPDCTFTWCLIDDLDGNHVELVHYE